MKKATENIMKTIEEAKVCKPAPEPKPIAKDPDLVNEFKNLVKFHSNFYVTCRKLLKIVSSKAKYRFKEYANF